MLRSWKPARTCQNPPKIQSSWKVTKKSDFRGLPQSELPPGTKPIHAGKKFLENYFFARIHAGPVFALTWIQENLFWGIICRTLAKFLREFISVQIHVAPVFAPAQIQENIPGELFMYWFRARGYKRPQKWLFDPTNDSKVALLGQKVAFGSLLMHFEGDQESHFFFLVTLELLCLVDVSDIFYFFSARGWGRGRSRRQEGGVVGFSLKIAGGGVSLRTGGGFRGAGGCLRGIFWAEGLNISFFGAEIPTKFESWGGFGMS